MPDDRPPGARDGNQSGAAPSPDPRGASRPALHPVFSTAGLSARDGFRHWEELLGERLIPIAVKRLDEGPFQARLDFAKLGALQISRLTQGALRAETTPSAARRHDHSDKVVVLFKIAGRSTTFQDGREAVQAPGDIVVLDHGPSVVVTHGNSQALFVEVPRARLEAMLGPVRLYTALSLGADRASTILATRFLNNLIRTHARLAPDTLARLSEISVDLVVASIAERLAREVPQPLHGTIVVQRAKAYVEAHLHEPGFDPPALAGALGVSLRRLQELFHARGQHISDYIWERRLEAAARRLADPACAHLSIGALAYDCGFASQAHFARRFRERHGMTPTEFRRAALLGVA